MLGFFRTEQPWFKTVSLACSEGYFLCRHHYSGLRLGMVADSQSQGGFAKTAPALQSGGDGHPQQVLFTSPVWCLRASYSKQTYRMGKNHSPFTIDNSLPSAIFLKRTLGKDLGGYSSENSFQPSTVSFSCSLDC